MTSVRDRLAGTMSIPAGRLVGTNAIIYLFE